MPAFKNFFAESEDVLIVKGWDGLTGSSSSVVTSKSVAGRKIQ